jgi:hypothetical protein
MTFIPKNTGHYTDRSNTPTAHITVKKQRIKQFSNSVYLKDGDEFEIELFNPTRKTILSKISINGNYISDAGIIIKPGQRVFLERYIDVDKKFVFTTYEVNGKNKEVLDAIQDNGLIQIEFYNERTPNWLNNLINTGTSSTTTVTNINYPHTFTLTGSEPYWTNIGTSVNYSQNFTSDSNTLSFSDSLSKSTIETGRVEKGEKSEQEINYTNDYSFEYFSFHNITWKILPQSSKPIEIDELKKYCHNCGSKIKKSTYKFCPNCGTKLD